MHLCIIATEMIQKVCFDENPTWQVHKSKGRAIMATKWKIWLMMLLYLIYLWHISLVIIMVLTKLL